MQSRDLTKAKDQNDANEKTITDLTTKNKDLTSEIKAHILKLD